jgi:hypothetical protein
MSWSWGLKDPEVLRRYCLKVYCSGKDFHTILTIFNEVNELRRRDDTYANEPVEYEVKDTQEQARRFYFYDYRKLCREFINTMRSRLDITFELIVLYKGVWFDAEIDNEENEDMWD